MSEFYPVILSTLIQFHASRSDEDRSLGTRVRAYWAGVAATRVLRNFQITGAGDGATWLAMSTTVPVANVAPTDLPLTAAEVEFRTITDSEHQIDVALDNCLAAIAARHPVVGTTFDVGATLIAGAGCGHIWLVGVVCNVIPPIP